MTTELIPLQTNMGASSGLLRVIRRENMGHNTEYDLLLKAAVKGRVPLVRTTESKLDILMKLIGKHYYIDIF